MPENTAMSDAIIECRRRASFTGILDVENFDEQEIVATSQCGELLIKGSELKICRLSVETGDMTVEGRIDSVSYDDIKEKRNLLSRLFG